MIRYALAQINVTVGDLDANAAHILRTMNEANAHSPDLVIFPELTLAGYPPEDLLFKESFVDRCAKTFLEMAAQIHGRALVGYPARGDDGRLYNTAALIENGAVVARYDKNCLPNYSVFDEERYFTRGQNGLVLTLGVQRVGVVICEDAWEDTGPHVMEAAAGAQVIVCLSASPFHRGKDRVRIETFARLCQQNRAYFLYCNLLGGQDELVFDGGSLVMNPQGEVLLRGKEFAEDLLIFDLDTRPEKDALTAPEKTKTENHTAVVHHYACDISPTADRPALPSRDPVQLSEVESTYEALVLGVGDYVRKSGFSGVLIGLSGGIDSALTAAIAVDALGAEHVYGVTMPSRYSSGETKSDAELLAQNLHIQFSTLPVEQPFRDFCAALNPLYAHVEGDPENITEQNIQARIRAVFLMALSNKLGYLVLNTSNKSECAVGYGTLYGDMAGGYAAIKDVLKLAVWDLSRYVNERHGREVIPVATIERPPSAELRPDQLDNQSLPDYEILDPILELYVEQDQRYADIVAAGHDAETVKRIIRLVDRAEYKRRQAVIGVRVTPKAFGKDRRLPVVNGYREW